MSGKNKRFLFWFPAVVLPICNIISAMVTHAEFEVSHSLPYLLGAAAEELFYRRFLLKTVLLPCGKPRLAILAVAILFAGMHLFNLRAGAGLHETLVQMVSAFCFSVWAGAVTWKGTWLLPLAAHVLLNLTAATENAAVSLILDSAVLADGIVLMQAEKTQ